ncbi:hypothetical protein [Actinomycetospora soli]|uniref:hypothetical protein n=1 Tax=Actinomycetospora soli TaxID=2893887 RepID=UPI001E419E4C|nr:hypothetical protein [Actinomycetospora soli]MCD2188309.1 hypothetical protein [Actinomycetospora soli]
MSSSPPLPTVLVVPARPDGRGLHAASRAVDLLVGLAQARVATPDDHPGLVDQLPGVDHVVVLDPGRWRATFTAHPALGAPARTADRLALLRVLRERPGRVRWVGRPDQFEAVRDLLSARTATATAAVRG